MDRIRTNDNMVPPLTLRLDETSNELLKLGVSTAASLFSPTTMEQKHREAMGSMGAMYEGGSSGTWGERMWFRCVYIPGLGAVWQGSEVMDLPSVRLRRQLQRRRGYGIRREGVRLVKVTRMRRASSEEELQWGRRVECPKTSVNCLQAPLPCVPSFQNVHMSLGDRIPGGPFSGETTPEFDQGSDPRFSSWLHCQSSHSDHESLWCFPPWDWYLGVLWRGSPLHARSMGIIGVHRKVMTKSVEDGHGEVLYCWERRVGAECSSSLMGMGHIRMWLLAASR
ncbi:hypothetical protein DFH09DRAFT_1088405 [Mycena vulgaris]|nr:hypothetical protein DFH09DRAFT_1088405 [Mycena vulgaris]